MGLIFNADQSVGLGAKTTRSACATPNSNTFWQFLLKLPSSGALPDSITAYAPSDDPFGP